MSLSIDDKRQIVSRFNAIMRRRVTTPWSQKEKQLLRTLVSAYSTAFNAFYEDLKLIEEFYENLYQQSLKPPFSDYRRRDMETLLRNFSGEVDKANLWKSRQTVIRQSVADDGPTGWRDAIARIYKNSNSQPPSSWSTVDEGTKVDVINMIKNEAHD